MKPLTLVQTRQVSAFRCIGAACEDTCCIGWTVHVDRATYDKYQACGAAELGSSLHSLITINEKNTDDDDYAKVALQGAVCPFLSDGLCSIQRQLGEDYLPNMCATYPRVVNRVDRAVHRSLDLSCPEAARLILLDPQPLAFEEQPYADGSIRNGRVPAVDTSRLGESLDPYDFFRAVQRTVIALLQNRSRPLWKRLFLMGYLCEKLDKIDDLSAIQTYIDGIQGGIGDDLAARHSLVEDSADLRTQLEVVLELIVARIGSDSNPPRFLECYREFIEGLQWTSKSTIDELSRHYAESFFQHYVPFMNRHEHMLEHYLVQYAFRTLFPFGLPESNRRLRHDRVPSPITTQYMAQYMWMAANYAIARTLLIGMAGFHKSAFSAEHVVKLVQSCTKTFEHSEAYPGQAIEILAGRNMASAASLCVLIRN